MNGSVHSPSHLTPFIHLYPLCSLIHLVSFSSPNVAFFFYLVLFYLATLLLLSTSDSFLHFALCLSSCLLNFISWRALALLAILRRAKDLTSRCAALPFPWPCLSGVTSRYGLQQLRPTSESHTTDKDIFGSILKWAVNRTCRPRERALCGLGQEAGKSSEQVWKQRRWEKCDGSTLIPGSSRP
jgi:hypothetical protein